MVGGLVFSIWLRGSPAFYAKSVGAILLNPNIEVTFGFIVLPFRDVSRITAK